MPTYSFSCACGTTFDRHLAYQDYDTPQICECGAKAERQICAPMLKISPDVCYESPIDGKPVTSMAKRREDLARSDCIPYDPEMKTDYRKRIERGERDLDRRVDETVEAAIEQMPARKKEALESEIRSGVTAEIVRNTV